MCAARARELTVRSSMRPLNLSGTQVSNHLVGKRPRSGSCCRSACTLLSTWQLNKANPTCCKSARYFLDWTCLSEKHAATPESGVSRCWYEHLIAFVRVAPHSRITLETSSSMAASHRPLDQGRRPVRPVGIRYVAGTSEDGELKFKCLETSQKGFRPVIGKSVK